MDSIVHKPSVKALRDALSRLSNDVDETYRAALGRILSQNYDDKTLAMRVLSWITHSLRPLYCSELQHALAITPDMSQMDEEAIVDSDILFSICMGLVVIEESTRIVRFVREYMPALFGAQMSLIKLFNTDYTAQEFFVANQKELFPTAQVDISMTCIAYLSLDNFKASDPDDVRGFSLQNTIRSDR